MDNLKKSALVLNRQWHPISTISVQNAITMLCGEFRDNKGKRLPKAKVLNVETWAVHDWDTSSEGQQPWITLVPSPDEPFLRSGGDKRIKIPEIIIVTRYYGIPHKADSFNKRNLFRRDQDTCQYCGQHGNTMDHVIPRCKGGQSTWENCVVACFDCNQKKRDRTLEEANMKLLRNPYKPGLEILSMTKIRYKSWEIFFKKRGE